MRTELPDGRVRFDGALDCGSTPDGLHPRRLPAWTRPRIVDPWMDLAVDAAAGVRLALRTTAETITLDVKVTRIALPDREIPASFDLVVGGEVVARQPSVRGDVLLLAADTAGARLEPGDPETIRFTGLPAGEKDVEIWLPHTASCSVAAVGTDAPLLPPGSPGGTRWVHHGSSISHGITAPAPTLAWPGVTALRTGASLTNLGFAGNAVLDPDVARSIAELPADVVTLELGINIVDGALMRERTFVPAVHGFLDLIRDGHPETPVVVLSPVSAGRRRRDPGRPGVALRRRAGAVRPAGRRGVAAGRAASGRRREPAHGRARGPPPAGRVTGVVDVPIRTVPTATGRVLGLTRRLTG